MVPLTCLEGETPQTMMRRAIDAVEATRKLRAKSGHVGKDGKDLLVWAAVSQPPEVRRRARFVAKSKRAVLEGLEQQKSGAAVGSLQVRADYRKGCVTIDGRRIAACSMQPTTEGVLSCEFGWVDAAAVCSCTHEPIQAFTERWRGLVEEIN